jgi:hypothetical protein
MGDRRWIAEAPLCGNRIQQGPHARYGRRGVGAKTYTQGDAIPIHSDGRSRSHGDRICRSRSIAGFSEGLIPRANSALDLAHVGPWTVTGLKRSKESTHAARTHRNV